MTRLWAFAVLLTLNGLAFAQQDWSQFRGDDGKTGSSSAKIAPPFKQKWVAPIGLVNSSPSIVKGTAYVGSYDGHLYAVDADTGKVRWRRKLGNPVYASPTIVDGRVYVCCTGEQGVREKDKQQTCRMVCLDAADGKTIWDHPLIRDDVTYDLGNWAGGWASCAVDAKHVYVGSDDRFIYAFDRNTGDVKWKYLTEGRVHSAQTLVEGILYSGCHDGYVYSLDAGIGKLKWKFKTGSLVNSTVAFKGGQVYFGSYDKHVYALKATDGTLLWKTETDPGMTSHIVASPAVTEDAVYIGTWPGAMYAFERKTGKVHWRTPLSGRIQASSTVANGVIYTLAHNRLVGLDVNTGKIVWEHRVGNAFATSTPTLAFGALYVGSREGLHCFVP